MNVLLKDVDTVALRTERNSMPPKKNDNDFDTFSKTLAEFGRLKLTPPLKEQTLEELVKEGYDLLQKEKLANKQPAPKQPTPVVVSSNPYKRAHDNLMREMPEEKRKVIEKMENGTLPKDSRYDTFVKEIAKLGDHL